MNEVKLLDHGYVVLEDFLASDLVVANAAKVSFNKQTSLLGPAEQGIIRSMMKNHHGTPFEHNTFRFRIKAPIFVFREWHRHRIGISINEWSARYSELRPEYYVPARENVRVQVGKPMEYRYERALPEDAEVFRAAVISSCEIAFGTYRSMLELGIAKEQARIVLPVNTYSEMIWSCNARSMMNFLTLRAAMTAQWEIQQYGHTLEQLFAKQMPVTYAAFIEYGRVAP